MVAIDLRARPINVPVLGEVGLNLHRDLTSV